jgi:hypothetical protein
VRCGLTPQFDMPLSKIISGAQTGIDRGALDAALEMGFPCGGACPQGRVAEDGRIPDRYPVIELDAGKYRARTILNVLDSDGTLVIYFSSLAGGTEQTVAHCIKKRKPYQLIDAIEITESRAAELTSRFIEAHHISTLNVAGPRVSQQANGQRYAFNVVVAVIERIRARDAASGA